MKKAISLVLAMLLVLGLTVSAFAAESPVAPVENEQETAALPVVVDLDPDMQVVTVNNAKTLPEEDQKNFAEAQQTLKDAVPEGMMTRYFFYVMNKGGAAKDVTMKMANAKSVAAKLFNNGKWNTLETVVNDNGTVVIKNVTTGALAVFTGK